MQNEFERFKTIFKKAPLGMFLTSQEGQFIDLNEELARILGYQSIDEVKTKIRNIGRDLYVKTGERSKIQKEINDKDEISVYEVKFKQKNGNIIDVKLSISPYITSDTQQHRYIGIVEDITQTKQQQKLIQLNEERFRTLFYNAPVGIIRFSLQCEVLLINEYFSNTLGYDNSLEFMNQNDINMRDIIVVPQEYTGKNFFDDFCHNKNSGQLQLKRTDGSIAHVHYKTSPVFSPSGAIEYVDCFAIDISETIYLEKQLEERESLLSSIIACLPFEMWVFDKDGTIIEQSAYSRKKWGDYRSINRNDFPYNYDNDTWETLISSALNGNTMDIESAIVINNKKQYFKRLSAPLTDKNKIRGAINISFNISQRIKAEKQVEKAHNFLETLINSIPVRVFWKNAKMEIIGANQSFLEDVKISSQEQLIGKTDYDILNKADADRNDRLFSQVMQSQQPLLNLELSHHLPDQKQRWVLGSVIPYYGESRAPEGVLCCYQDITEIKKLELELKKHQNHLEKLVQKRTLKINQLNQELMASNEELLTLNEALSEQKLELEKTLNQLRITQQQLIQSEKMASIGILTAGIAHEINNPLNFINSGIYALESCVSELIESISNTQKPLTSVPPNSDDINETINNIEVSIQSIRTGVERSIQIVKGLRSFSRLDSEQKSEAHIEELIDSALTILKKEYIDTIDIVKNLETIPAINCYPGKLSQLFLNILINSIHATTNKGTITITAQLLKIDQEILISIKDTGHGIPDNIKSKIFDPFFTTKPVGEGTGLGLSIVHSIVDEHQGKIVVNSEKDKGTEFLIWLPIR